VNEFVEMLAPHAYGWPASLEFTYRTAYRLAADGVPGAMVECGVANGVHPAAMHHATAGARTVHLFDSFEGLPHCGPHDRDFQAAGYGDGTGRLSPIGVSACSLQQVRANLTTWGIDPDWFRFHPGWFQDTVPADADDVGPIAFLRLDGDLYDSTLVCLEHLYPLVSSGGVVVVDDWNLDGCRQAVRDYFTLCEGDFELSYIPAMEDITESGDVWWVKR
jgi:O-methyltransferase